MLQVDITKTPLYELAMEKGMEKGLEKGMEKGMEKGIFDTAIIMMEKMNHSIDEIVKVLNIKKEELLEYMKKKKEEA
jgi:flagellar biosynthesis/type III secretory pathway protein FliH